MEDSFHIDLLFMISSVLRTDIYKRADMLLIFSRPFSDYVWLDYIDLENNPLQCVFAFYIIGIGLCINQL